MLVVTNLLMFNSLMFFLLLLLLCLTLFNDQRHMAKNVWLFEIWAQHKKITMRYTVCVVAFDADHVWIKNVFAIVVVESSNSIITLCLTKRVEIFSTTKRLETFCVARFPLNLSEIKYLQHKFSIQSKLKSLLQKSTHTRSEMCACAFFSSVFDGD